MQQVKGSGKLKYRILNERWETWGVGIATVATTVVREKA